MHVVNVDAVVPFQFKNRRAKWRKRERHVGTDFKAANFASTFAPAMIMQPAGMQTTFDDPTATFYGSTTPGYSSWPPPPTAAGRFAADSARAFAAAGAAAAWTWKPTPVGPPMLSPAAGQSAAATAAVQSTQLARYGSAMHQSTGAGGASTSGFGGLFGPAGAVGCPCAVPQSPYGNGATSIGGNMDVPPLTRIKSTGPATPTPTLPNFGECQYVPISGVTSTLSTR